MRERCRNGKSVLSRWCHVAGQGKLLLRRLGKRRHHRMSQSVRPLRRHRHRHRTRAGKVRVTLATPEPFVSAITLDPVNIFSPFPVETVVSDPALVVKKTLAPVAVPPDDPGLKVTVSTTGKAVPTVPVCASPAVFASVAAGLVTSTQPFWVVETPLPSVAGTEKK